MKYALQLWDQAGERPYEVLIHEGVYEPFMNYLESQSYYLDDTIFRGTQRHGELNIGDNLEYTYPTSWSTLFNSAYNFVYQEPFPVILSLYSKKPLKAISNQENTYKESEIILYPISLVVINKYIQDKVIILEVIHI